MGNKDFVILALGALAILLIIVGLSTYQQLKNAIDEWAEDIHNLNYEHADEIAEWEKKYNDLINEHPTFKVEKVISQPLELKCCLQLDTDIPEDAREKILHRMLCDEFLKAFEENENLCLIQTEDDLCYMRQNIIAKVRFLPYLSQIEY